MNLITEIGTKITRQYERYARQGETNPTLANTKETWTKTFFQSETFYEEGEIIDTNGVDALIAIGGKWAVVALTENPTRGLGHRYETLEAAKHQLESNRQWRDYEDKKRELWRAYEASLKELNATHPYKTQY